MPLSVGELVGYLRLEGGAQFDRGVASASGEMSGASQSAQRMAGAMAKAEANLARAGRQSNVAAEGSARLRASNLSLLAATERYNGLLGQENASLRQLALAEAAVIRANEGVRASAPAATMRETTVAAEQSSGAIARTAGSMAAAAKSAIGLGAAFGAFELVKHAIDSGKELTDALNGVQAVSRATDEQMKAVRAQAIGLGKDLTVPGATAIDAADAILELVKAGIALPRALDAARPALLLASATQTNMADTARVLGDTMDIWSIKGAGASHTAKILGSAALGASHDLVGLFDALKQAGPSARALNIGLDDTATALVFLAKHGLSTGLGGTGLKVLFSTLSKDTPAGTKALQDLGVTAFDTQGKFEGFPKLFDQLHGAQGRFGDDSHRFLHDLNAAFGSRAQNVASLFATSTGKDFDDLRKRLESGDLQKFADTMNHGVAASFRQLQKETTAAGIDAYSGAEPALTSLLQLIGKGVPAAVELAKAALTPFGAAWHLISDGAGPVAHFLGDILGLLHPLAPVLEGAGAAALSMWLAFKAFQGARALVAGAVDAVGAMQVKMLNARLAAQSYGSTMGATFAGNATAAERAALQQDAASAQVTAAAAREAAEVSAAKAEEAEAYAALVMASEDASAKQIVSSQNTALAAQEQATVAEAAATETAASAEAASTAVVAAGDEAAIGWAGMAGPLGLAAVGVLSLVTLFHHSTTASKEAKDAAKAYADALGSSSKSDLVDTITKQLKDNDLPAELKKINAGLSGTAFTGKQFVDAITAGNPALGTLRARLQAVVDAGTQKTPQGRGIVYTLTPAAKAAQAALGHLNTQYNVLTKTAAKDLLDTKTFAGASGAIQKTTAATKLGTEAAKQYAVMAGLEVDKNGIVAASQSVVNAAVTNVANAYDTATSSGSDYLTALDAFSKSSGTAADRATLIGATLKAANGDALGFASAMNAGATASTQLDTDIASAAKSVGKSGVSVRSFIKSIVDLKTGSIEYSKAGAAPLITDLQGMQTAAMTAASAMFQHERSTKGAKGAADDAYTTFQRLTSGALVGQAKQLGLTSTEAGKLATKYFGIPKDVKTAIEAEGTDPVVSVLNRIGQLLANLTGQQWNLDVKFHVNAAATENTLHNLQNKLSGRGLATGTGPEGLPLGLSSVGEQGPELAYNDGVRTHIIPNGRAQVLARGLAGIGVKMPGFAGGTGNASKIASALSSAFGLTNNQIAGILGNLQVESGFNPLAHNPRENAWGLAQWEGPRLTALQKYASSHNMSFKSLDAQIGYLIKELRGSRVIGEIKKMSNPGSIAALVDAQFERSAGTTRGARISAAQSLAGQLKSGGITSTGGSGVPGTSKPTVASSLSILAQLAKLGPEKNASSFSSNLSGLEQKLTTRGLGSFVKSLGAENKKLLAEARNRDHAATLLAAATQKVKDANKARTDDYNSFRSTVLTAYDITSAGQDADGKVTGGGLVASETQELTKIRVWSTGMKRLIGSKVFPATYLRSLLGKGPESLPTVQALLSLSGAQMASFANTEKSIEALASGPNSVALLGAKRLDDPAIAAASAFERSAAASVSKYQKALNTELNAFLHELEHKLGNQHASIDFKAGTLSLATASDAKKTKKRKATK